MHARDEEGGWARAPRRRRRSRNSRPPALNARAREALFTGNNFCVGAGPCTGVDLRTRLHSAQLCVCGGAVHAVGGVHDRIRCLAHKLRKEGNGLDAGGAVHPVDGVDHGHQLRVALEAQQRLRHRVQRPHNLPRAAPRRAARTRKFCFSCPHPFLVLSRRTRHHGHRQPCAGGGSRPTGPRRRRFRSRWPQVPPRKNWSAGSMILRSHYFAALLAAEGPTSREVRHRRQRSLFDHVPWSRVSLAGCSPTAPPSPVLPSHTLPTLPVLARLPLPHPQPRAHGAPAPDAAGFARAAGGGTLRLLNSRARASLPGARPQESGRVSSGPGIGATKGRPPIDPGGRLSGHPRADSGRRVGERERRRPWRGRGLGGRAIGRGWIRRSRPVLFDHCSDLSRMPASIGNQ